MSVAYHRLKMKLTRGAVGYARNFCDGCNHVISFFVSPFSRIGKRISAEAPWVVFILASTFVMVIPLLAYPYLKPIIGRNPRHDEEEERVRLCLQKGIDPYPYMRHKELVYGNKVTAFSTEKQNPKDSAWEYTSLLEFQRRKEELRQQVGGDIGDTVQKLLDLRKQQQRQFASRHTQINQEPKDVTFPGRSDSDQLLS
ncbi:unnamed protein product [Phytomonas sp. EM1]|nr:unnamed protein product [Phytomonas sp. EM1]|eukprot:CCW60770.1 unnamed protein product [Phytomonas sp. isolate EM1]